MKKRQKNLEVSVTPCVIVKVPQDTDQKQYRLLKVSRPLNTILEETYKSLYSTPNISIRDPISLRGKELIGYKLRISAGTTPLTLKNRIRKIFESNIGYPLTYLKDLKLKENELFISSNILYDKLISFCPRTTNKTKKIQVRPFGIVILKSWEALKKYKEIIKHLLDEEEIGLIATLQDLVDIGFRAKEIYEEDESDLPSQEIDPNTLVEE